MANRLAGAASPYLLQHADNPVDWWPWSAEAFAQARERDVPVFLSVGYAACHWCHVMAHESFEDVRTAKYLNAHFVNIKVDREERPDVDAVYMTATQAMTGHGGWPMSVFLTPEGDPFHCGTYFPPEPSRGMPSFMQVATAVTDTWQQRGEQVRDSAAQISEELRRHTAPLPAARVDAELIETAVTTLDGEFDAERGGFGPAPKFPPSMVLEFLLRHHERTGSAPAKRMVDHTLSAMARGGIYDQLAGGFARYSVDADWTVPHFEKMLYDNGLLLRVYAHAARGGSALARRVTEQTAEFLLTDLRTEQGAFSAALDADTEGAEGLTYVWTPAQLIEVLGESDGAWAAELLGVTERGTFERGSSTLRMPADPLDEPRWGRVRAALLSARRARPQPACDDKVVTEWNGLAISALTEAGLALDREDWLDAARTAADFLLTRHLVDGRLLRTSRGGVAGSAQGVLADYGCFAEALLCLHQATGEASWLDRACAVLDTALERFAGAEGSWFDTADDAERLFTRPADPTDNATPSGASSVAEALLTASVLAEPRRAGAYARAAEQTVARAGSLAGKAPRFAGLWLAVAEAAQRGPLQVAVVGAGAALYRGAVEALPGGSVLVSGQPDAQGIPLLADRPLVHGQPAAYVCRGFVCDRPVTSVADLRAQLAN